MKNALRMWGLAISVFTATPALADEATVTVGVPEERHREWRADERFVAREPELYRSPFRLAVGPTGVSTGHGFGYGVGLAADIGTGTVGGRFSAAWLRGEGKNDDGTSSPTGDSVGLYTGELTLDFQKRGRLHPVLGIGAGVLHASRTDHRSGFAGVGTSRLALDYALGLDDADVRLGADVLGGLIGPVDDEIRPLHAFVQPGVHVAIGF